MRVFLCLTLLLLFTACFKSDEDLKTPMARQGDVFAQNWDYAAHGPLVLDGPWELYWGKLLESPSPTAALDPLLYRVNGKGGWKGETLRSGEVLGEFGCATYHMHLHVSDGATRQMVLSVPHLNSAWKAWVKDSNGKTLAESLGMGNPSCQKDTAVSRLGSGTLEFQSKDSVHIILQASNWEFPNGGILSPPLLEPKNDTKWSLNDWSPALFMGMSFAMAVYGLIVYFQRRSEVILLSLAVFSFLNFFHIPFRNFDTLSHYFHIESATLQLFWADMLPLLMSFPLLHVFYKVDPTRFSKTFSSVFYAVIFVFIFILFTLSQKVISYSKPAFYGLFFIFAFYANISLSIEAFRKHDKERKILFFCFIVFTILCTVEMMNIQNYYTFNRLSDLGCFILITGFYSFHFLTFEKRRKRIEKEAREMSLKNRLISFMIDTTQEFSSFNTVEEVYSALKEKARVYLNFENISIVELNSVQARVLDGEDVWHACFALSPEKIKYKTGHISHIKNETLITIRPFERGKVENPILLVHAEPTGIVKPLTEFQSHQAYALADAAERALRHLQSLNHAAELQTARSVQAALMPSTELISDRLQTWSHWESAGAVGGDWYGYVETQGSAFLFMCDASGHGPSAALMAAVARSAISSVKSLLGDAGMDRLQPSDILLHLNSLVLESGKGEVLMTGLCLKIPREGFEATYSNAGHVPLIQLIPEKAPQFHQVMGNRLGFKSDVVYRNKVISLREESRFLLMTDGLLEAENRAGDLYGQKRLLKALLELTRRKGLMADSMALPFLLSDVARFQEGMPFPDDVTLCWARVRPSASHNSV